LAETEAKVKLSSSVIKASPENHTAVVWLPQNLGDSALEEQATPQPAPAYPWESDTRLRVCLDPLADHSATSGGSISPWQPAPLIPTHSLTASAPNFSGREASPRRPMVHDPLVEELARQAARDARQEAEAQAMQVLIAVQQQADHLIQNANQQAAAIAAQAQRDGFAAGQSEAERLLRAARTVVDEIYAWRESMLHQSEAGVLTLVADIARTIFGNGLALPENVLKTAFEQALVEAKHLGDIQIRLHPEDVAVLGTYWKREQTMTHQKIDLIPDAAVRRGGYLVEGQYGVVDARVETQMKFVMDKLTETASAKEVQLPVFAIHEAQP
jgi:flagellar assembly protein FliH